MGKGQAPEQNITNMREARAAPPDTSQLANPEANESTISFEEYLKQDGSVSLSAAQESASEEQASESSSSNSSSSSSSSGNSGSSAHQRAGTKGR